MVLRNNRGPFLANFAWDILVNLRMEFIGFVLHKGEEEGDTDDHLMPEPLQRITAIIWGEASSVATLDVLYHGDRQLSACT